MRVVASAVAWTGFLIPLMTATAWAEPAPPADDTAQAESRLDVVLREWAKASEAVQESHFTVQVTDYDSTVGEARHSRLEVFVKKPDLIRIDARKEDGSLDSSFVYKKGVIHDFRPSDREEIMYSLPSDFGFPAQPERYPEDWMSRLKGGGLEHYSWIAVGPPVWNLKERFNVRLTKEDDYWVCLELKPRQQQDHDSIKHMQVVLEKKTFRVRRLWIESPNFSQQTFDFQKPNGGSEEGVTPEIILKGLPEDYKKVDLGCPEDALRKWQGGDGQPTKP